MDHNKISSQTGHTNITTTKILHNHNNIHLSSTQPQHQKNQNHLKCLQVNLGRGKEATLLLENYIKKHNIDIVLLQEPYKYKQKTLGYTFQHSSKDAKTQIWTKQQMGGILLRQDMSNNNITTIDIKLATKTITISCVYDEPGGNTNTKFNMMKHRWQNMNKPLLIAGDLNAHHEAWGGDVTDARGEDLLEWCVSNGLTIVNDNNSTPTFDCNRGKSWIDVTITNNMNITNWKVQEEETLSDHKYVTFEIITAESTNTRRAKRTYDFNNTDWKTFKEDIKYINKIHIPRPCTQEELEKICQKMKYH